MTHNTKEFFIVRKWRQLTAGWAPHREEPLPASDLDLQMQQASIPSLGFFYMLALAAGIATFGLMDNSAPTIIGAMIIAPLMSPIMSLSFGLVAFDKRLIVRSFMTVIAGVILVLGLAYIITLLFGFRVTGSEILDRTSPSVIDFGVAILSGGAAAFAYTRRSILSSIAGVAIAVALVPPLAVSGIGLALGDKATAEIGGSLSAVGLHFGGSDIAYGAFLLFLTNFIGIVSLALLVFISQRYGEWKKALLALLLVLGLSVFLIEPLSEELHRMYVKHRVVRLITKLADTATDIVTGRSKVISLNVTHRGGVLHVNADIVMPRHLLKKAPLEQKNIDRFREYLSEDIGEPVVLELEIVPIDVIQFRSTPPKRQTSKPTSDNRKN